MEQNTIKNPSARGCSDYWAGVSDAENPYIPGTPEHAAWLAAWRAECDQDARDMFDAE